MTLKERAFMIDLIKRNYRRRTAWLCFEFLLIIFGLFGLLLTWLNSYLLINHVVGALIIILSGCIITGVLLMVFFDKPYGMDDLSPSGIKERQLKVLEENRKTDFEELICIVPLKEYFEI